MKEGQKHIRIHTYNVWRKMWGIGTIGMTLSQIHILHFYSFISFIHMAFHPLSIRLTFQLDSVWLIDTPLFEWWQNTNQLLPTHTHLQNTTIQTWTLVVCCLSSIFPCTHSLYAYSSTYLVAFQMSFLLLTSSSLFFLFFVDDVNRKYRIESGFCVCVIVIISRSMNTRI